MHPAAIVFIVLGVPLALWAGYETASFLHDQWSERQERRQYEEYVRSYYEKTARTTSSSGLSRNHSDDDDDDEPLVRSMEKKSGYDLRYRGRNKHDRKKPWEDDCELFEMEQSILERKQRLLWEQEQLEQAELDLQRRRALLQNRGNAILGMSGESESRSQGSDTSQPVLASISSVNSNQTEIPLPPADVGHAGPPSDTLLFPSGRPFSPPPAEPHRPVFPVDTDAVAPQLSGMDAEWAALAPSSRDTSDQEDDDQEEDTHALNRTMRLPYAEERKLASDSEESWADVSGRARTETDASYHSFSSFQAPQQPPSVSHFSENESHDSFGVASLSDDDMYSVGSGTWKGARTTT